MKSYGIQKRIEALNDKYLIGYETCTRIERPIMVPGKQIEGEPYSSNPQATGEVIIREVKSWRL